MCLMEVIRLRHISPSHRGKAVMVLQVPFDLFQCPRCAGSSNRNRRLTAQASFRSAEGRCLRNWDRWVQSSSRHDGINKARNKDDQIEARYGDPAYDGLWRCDGKPTPVLHPVHFQVNLSACCLCFNALDTRVNQPTAQFPKIKTNRFSFFKTWSIQNSMDSFCSRKKNDPWPSLINQTPSRPFVISPSGPISPPCSVWRILVKVSRSSRAE